MIQKGLILLLLPLILWLIWAYKKEHISSTKYTYSVEFHSSSLHDLNPLFKDTKAFVSPKQVVKIDFFGTLNETIIGKKDSFNEVVFEWESLSLNLLVNEQSVSEMELYLLKEEIKKPMLAYITDYGKIIKVATDTTVSPTVDILWRQLIALQQIEWPKYSQTVDTIWETKEEEPMGQYRSQVSIYKDLPDSILFVKEKKGYDKISGNYGYLGKPSIIGYFKGDIRMNKKNKKSVQLSIIDNKYLMFKADTAAYTNIHYNSKMLTKTEGDEESTIKYKNLFNSTNYSLWGTLSDDPSWVKMKVKAYKKSLGADTFESLRIYLKMANENNIWNDTLYEKLKALIYLQPYQCKFLVKEMKVLTVNSTAFNTIINAFSSVAHPEAQAALVEILKIHSDNEMVLHEVLPFISTIKTPLLVLEQAISKLAFSNRQTDGIKAAQLALGSIAYNLRLSDIDRANAITIELIKNLKNRTDNIQYILVMGNIGTEQSFTQLKPFLLDTTIATQSLAITNLRLIELPEVDSLLNNLGKNARSEAIKKIALETIEFRQHSKFDQ